MGKGHRVLQHCNHTTTDNKEQVLTSVDSSMGLDRDVKVQVTKIAPKTDFEYIFFEVVKFAVIQMLHKLTSSYKNLLKNMRYNRVNMAYAV